MLASLNHPNIATIYGFEGRTALHALVLELVDGETLPIGFARGPVACRRGARDRPADCRRARRRSRERHRAPRSQAGQHQAHARRRGQGAGLRTRQGGRATMQPSRDVGVATITLGGTQEGRHRRHAGLHEPRAGARPAGRQAHRHLGVRLRALRDAHRPRARSRARPSPTRSPRSSSASPSGMWCAAPHPPRCERCSSGASRRMPGDGCAISPMRASRSTRSSPSRQQPRRWMCRAEDRFPAVGRASRLACSRLRLVPQRMFSPREAHPLPPPCS